MKQSAAWLYILLGFATVLWLYCLVQVLFFPKASSGEPHISATVSYPSAYKSLVTVRPVSSSLSEHPFSSVIVPTAPNATRPSTSLNVAPASTRMYTLSSQRVTQVGGGNATGPVASTVSGNSSTSRGIVYSQVSVSMPSVQGLLTSASLVGGGMTASDTYARMTRAASPHKAPSLPPGVCEECHWEWNGTTWVCTQCGADVLDGCHCEDEIGYCWCPVGDGWEVWFFVTALAGAYALYKARARKEQTKEQII